MLWEIDIYPRAGQPNLASETIAAEARELGIGTDVSVTAAYGYLLQGKLSADEVEKIAEELLSDQVVEQVVFGPVGDAELQTPPNGKPRMVHVLPKPGVMDPVAQSAVAAIRDFDVEIDAVRTMRKYWFADLSDEQLQTVCSKLLANDAIEQVIVGPLDVDELEIGKHYEFSLVHVPIRDLDDEGLMRLSLEGQLYLQLAEMQTIRDKFRDLDRDPTDIELESLAQTWSEHCSHKTLAGRVQYEGAMGATGETGSRSFENMLKETIFAATLELREQWGDNDWCVSVFADNAGIVRFDEENNIVFKVETHNHPSALEPYGGANTGIGGVIRDPLGTGMGAKPICNTDVFCFAPPDMASDDLPPGVLHPQRVMKGVVSGVRDYGNRMGIPTVNGALYFDERYLGNPLVYCGNVGIIPRDQSFKEVMAGDWIVAVGGRTGRDGIHGATFSSAELTQESESLSGGAVQIGNAITEKMVHDVILTARDRGLYSAITDCGAGGFSSAVGEMGEEIGAEVWLDRAPLKYDGLSYDEIWISEAQERMVLSVPAERLDELVALCESEGVEASVIGKFEPTGRLVLKYQDHEVGDLSMEFLHDGRPPVIRQARYQPPAEADVVWPEGSKEKADLGQSLLDILGSLNVASKEWVIRQYDHEVQGGSVVKPLVGVENDGPGDAAVVRPVLSSRRGVVVSCGMNPHYGEFDTYHMAASGIDEALRNCVAVGADPAQIAILDNFCWGDCEKPETLGSLVRASMACYDLAMIFETPFISGKDSLNNEFSYQDAEGNKQTIAIPPTLLISAMGQVADVSKCVTMDLKTAGNPLYLIGETKNELGGSHLSLVAGLSGGYVPKVDAEQAKRTFAAMHLAIDSSLVRACHDLSEGGLATAAAEMAFAGGLGAKLSTSAITGGDAIAALFSESNSRFLCEVPADKAERFEASFDGVACLRVGEVLESDQLTITGDADQVLLEKSLSELKEAWQSPLRW